MSDEKTPNNSEDPSLRDRNRELEERIRQLEEENEALRKENEIFRKELNAKGADIERLLELNKNLTLRAHLNSSDSSKPPSSDGFRKVCHRSLRKKTGRKPGGQPGHAGHHMEVPHGPDEIVEYVPSDCRGCPNLGRCREEGTLSCAEERYSVDVSIGIHVTGHRSLQAKDCPLGHDGAAAFPENVRAYVQYGDSVTELVGILSSYGAMSVSRIGCLLREALGLKISEGTVVSMVRRCAEKVRPALDEIRRRLIGSSVVHFDESGLRADNGLCWVHSASNGMYTYQTVDRKRGFDGMKAAGIIENFKGVGVHDCWLPYWSFEDMSHATCGAHFLRELNAIEEMEPDHEWVGRFRELLLKMKESKDLVTSIGADRVDPDMVETYLSVYDDIMRLADRERPPPQAAEGKRRPARGKERSLIERFQDLKPDVCRFVYDMDVPFTNNQAEQDIRNVKVKGKVAGCFRTVGGAGDYLRLMSYISTGRKHGVTSFAALKAAFDGDPFIVLKGPD